eukprot:TRINITY_DN3143_c0_g1_i1.p1 TRINITY_DN3143_c0_g1~~TRINITY_DN3143_c0_g1_i1.p1  ORF type:complete len:251 (+),score=30.56 TRINITY_DN3143_c0_g1_i1:35-787(+)
MWISFLNCVLLTFVPPFILYKSKLSESSIGGTCIAGGLVFLALQVVKIIILGSLFNSNTALDNFSDIVQDLISSVLGCAIDFAAVVLLLRYLGRGGSRIQRVLAIGTSFVFAESLISRLIPYWIGSRAIEFSWAYLQMSVNSNISLIYYISLAALSFICESYYRNITETKRRSGVDRTTAIYAVALLVTYSLSWFFVRLITSDCVSEEESVGDVNEVSCTHSWSTLFLHFGLVSLLGFASHSLFTSTVQE